jgi:hypothetical protein
MHYNKNRGLIMETEHPQNIENLKQEIVAQIADLSRLLGMIPSDDITVSEARTSFQSWGQLGSDNGRCLLNHQTGRHSG